MQLVLARELLSYYRKSSVTLSVDRFQNKVIFAQMAIKAVLI